ncbi:MAG: hypothetical protein IJT43_08735 [Stomatobaculum sp.]|nr:hypothetical protein [Stomatobaculum sp.]
MEKIQCTNCQAPLDWDGHQELLTCPYCGTRFDMREHIRKQGGGQVEVLQDCIGRGTVAAIPCIIQDANGACFLQCYVPSGWQIRCGSSGPDFGDPSRDGVHLSTTMMDPEEKAFMVIRTKQTVRHVEPSFMNQNGRRYLNTAGVQYGQGGLEGTERSAAEYEDEMFSYIFRNSPPEIRLLKEEDADDTEKKTQQQIISICQSKGLTASADWKRRWYLLRHPDGREQNAVAETRIVSYERMSQAGAPGNMGGGMFGGGNMGGMLGGLFGEGSKLSEMLESGVKKVQNAFRQRFWEVQYEFVLVADKDVANACLPEYWKVRSSVKYLPAFEQYRQKNLQYVQQCLNQMAADRAASNQRRMQMMMDTQQQIHNTMSEMQASASASHDRVASQWSDYMGGSGGYGDAGGAGSPVSSMDRVRNLQSEMIREVDTYYGNDGEVYEASTSYDKVYQGNQDHDTFVGTSGTTWDPGVDFDELNKTGGNY